MFEKMLDKKIKLLVILIGFFLNTSPLFSQSKSLFNGHWIAIPFDKEYNNQQEFIAQKGELEVKEYLMLDLNPATGGVHDTTAFVKYKIVKTYWEGTQKKMGYCCISNFKTGKFDVLYFRIRSEKELFARIEKFESETAELALEKFRKNLAEVIPPGKDNDRMLNLVYSSGLIYRKKDWFQEVNQWPDLEINNSTEWVDFMNQLTEEWNSQLNETSKYPDFFAIFGFIDILDQFCVKNKKNPYTAFSKILEAGKRFESNEMAKNKFLELKRILGIEN